MNSIKNVCVFCSSSNDLDEKYNIEAKELGKILSENKINIIHGGGIIGLMGHLINSAAKNKSISITGVVPERLNMPNIVSEELQKLVITKDMKDRKEYMRVNSDAFIALPGGFGTIEEFMEVITLKQLKYHQKPIVIINSYGFYNNILAQFEILFKDNFANESYRSLYFIANNPTEAINYLKTYKFTNIYDKYLKE
jgi:cytokinin riboside 5'-monophosphate phosphoribohydrolase